MTFVPHFSRRTGIVAVLFLVLLLGACTSLAEDITPPPNYTPPAPRAAQPVEVKSTVFPLVPPDPAQGAAIYAEKCLPCHGETGMGDGPQASKLSNPVAAIGSPEVARAASPMDWFNIVSVGNLERFMPGFSGSLNDRQRWDVVAYVYSLSTSAQELQQGQAVYEQNCAVCHGLNGRGDGERAAEFNPPPANWTNQERLAALSAQDMVSVISGGREDHPSFAGQIDEASSYAVAAYVHTLGLAGNAGQQAAAPADTTDNAGTAVDGGSETTGGSETSSGDAAAPAVDAITITGQVTNATPGGTVPGDLPVYLSAFSGMSPAFELEGKADASGAYSFENVEYNSDYVYFVRVDANGLTFNSDILHGTDVAGSQADLPVQIYETTTDLSSVRADRLHIFFDFSNPGVVQVVNLYIISNPSDRVIVAGSADGPVLQFKLPEGAQNLQFQDGELGARYVQTADGFGDRMSISPGMGQQQLLFAYTLPYDRKVDFDISSPIPVDAAIVMVPPAGVKLKSDKLIEAGTRDVQGMTFQMYQAGSALAAGESLPLELSGSAGENAGAASENPHLLLIAGIGVFGLVLAGTGVWLYRQRSITAEDEAEDEEAAEEVALESSETLLETIVALDDQYAAGSLPEAVYFERRAALKARLADALAREEHES